MKLETSILPRRDGTINTLMPDKTTYKFKQDTHGAMVCDIDNESHVAWLIDTGRFYPASDEDFEQASKLMRGSTDTDTADIMKMTRAELVSMAEDDGLIVKANDSKAEIIEMMRAAL